MQKELKEGRVSEIKPIREGMNNLPKTITFPQFPSITAYDDNGLGEEDASPIYCMCRFESFRPQLSTCQSNPRRATPCNIRNTSPAYFVTT